MKSKTQKKTPEIVFRRGKPAAVILDIDEYRGMLGRISACDKIILRNA
jgi:PHD/YefM family antitoxin component YafN of YafNO toxin-antitoxin module